MNTSAAGGGTDPFYSGSGTGRGMKSTRTQSEPLPVPFVRDRLNRASAAGKRMPVAPEERSDTRMRSRRAVWLFVIALGVDVTALHRIGLAQLTANEPSHYVVTVSGMT